MALGASLSSQVQIKSSAPAVDYHPSFTIQPYHLTTLHAYIPNTISPFHTLSPTERSILKPLSLLRFQLTERGWLPSSFIAGFSDRLRVVRNGRVCHIDSYLTIGRFSKGIHICDIRRSLRATAPPCFRTNRPCLQHYTIYLAHYRIRLIHQARRICLNFLLYIAHSFKPT